MGKLGKRNRNSRRAREENNSFSLKRLKVEKEVENEEISGEEDKRIEVEQEDKRIEAVTKKEGKKEGGNEEKEEKEEYAKIVKQVKIGKTSDDVLPALAIEQLFRYQHHRHRGSLFVNRNWYRIGMKDTLFQAECENLGWQVPEKIRKKTKISYFRFFKNCILSRTKCEMCGRTCMGGYMFEKITACSKCRKGEPRLQILTKLEVYKKFYLDALDIANIRVDNSTLAPQKYYLLSEVTQVAFQKFGGEKGFLAAKQWLRFELDGHLPLDPVEKQARLVELKLYKSGLFSDVMNNELGFPLLFPHETNEFCKVLSGEMSVKDFTIYWKQEVKKFLKGKFAITCIANSHVVPLIPRNPQKEVYCNVTFDLNLRHAFFAIIYEVLVGEGCCIDPSLLKLVPLAHR